MDRKMKIAAATIAALGLAAAPANGAEGFFGCDICQFSGTLVRDHTFLVPNDPDVGYITNDQVATAGYTNTCGALSDAVNDATIGPTIGATCTWIQNNFFFCCEEQWTPCGMCSGDGYPATLPVPDTPVDTITDSEYTCVSLGFMMDQTSERANNLNFCWDLQYAAGVECGCDSTPALPDLACSICGDDEVVDKPVEQAILPTSNAEGGSDVITMQCSAAQVTFNYAGTSRTCGFGEAGLIECFETQYCDIEISACIDCPTTEEGCLGDATCVATCFRPDGCLAAQTFAGSDCCDGVSPCVYCPGGVENPDQVVTDPIATLQTTTCGEIKSRYTDLAAATQLCTDIIAHAEAAGCMCNPTASPTAAPTAAPTISPTMAPTAVPHVDIASAQPSASPTAEIKATIIVSLAGVANATMGSNDTDVFQGVFLEVLKQELVGQDVFITDVIVVNQDISTTGARALSFEGDLDVIEAAPSQGESSPPRVLLVGSNDGRSLLSSSVLDVTTDIIGWYIPPPKKNLEELAEDSINANGDTIRQDLQNASATDYFDPVTSVSARQLPSETPSTSPSSNPTEEPTAEDTSAALWNVRVGVFSLARMGLVCAIIQSLLW